MIRVPAPAPRRSCATLVCALLLATTGCRDDGTAPPATTLDAETFIATYVDLRAAALREGGGLISEAARDEVLSRHGVSEAELTGFVDAHGTDVAFMRDVWDEVERRLDALRPDREDSPSGSAP